MNQIRDAEQLQTYALRTSRNSLVIITGWLFASGKGGGFAPIETHPYKRTAASAAALAAFADQLALYTEVERKYCAKP